MGNVDGPTVSHQVYLIRHGETVDNVAGLYAGSRDSDLTVHGVQQAKRLGQHFQDNGIYLTDIFASNLSRAVKTACALRDAQQRESTLKITQCEDLREQDFGSLEGKSFHSRQNNASHQGSNLAEGSRRHDTEFKEVESHESMALRAIRFLDLHLAHVLSSPEPSTVAIVSHGMLLGSLWRCILQRQPPNSTEVDAAALSDSMSSPLHRIGSWSNTGYLHLEFISTESGESMEHMGRVAGSPDHPHLSEFNAANPNTGGDMAGILSNEPVKSGANSPFKIRVRAINSRDHLQGLKRAKGGIGSSRYDEKQKSIGAFFNKQGGS